MAAAWMEVAVLVLAMLVLGSFNTINSKLMYQTACPALPSGERLFNKPWLTNMFMFMAEASLLIPFSMRRKRGPSGLQPDTSPLKQQLVASQPKKKVSAPLYIFLVPASCDVLGTGIAAVAMMYVNAAVWQMMRGSIIVFSAVLTVVFLGRSLRGYHWIGVGLTTAALLLIGLAAVLEEPHAHGAGHHDAHSGAASLGVGLVVLAQVFAAFQMTFEEHLLTGYEVSSMLTVGMEGSWGCLLMAGILSVMTSVPGGDHGVYESFPEGLHMIFGSGQLEALIGTYMLSIALYNYTGMQICRKLSAVTRCLVDSMRTAVVWGLQLALYYYWSPRYGHPWTVYSWLQLLGFFLLVLGTLVYNGVMKVPTLSYRYSRFETPAKVVQATWSPTVNRAAAWGHGKYGPHSPGASPPTSPGFSSPSSSPKDAVEDSPVVMEGMPSE